MEVKRVFLWVNSDLDGVGSTILLGNMFPDFEYRPCFFGDFERQWGEWYDDNFFEYDKVFVVGMVLNQKLINNLDDSSVIFVDDNNIEYNTFKSTLISEKNTSCTKLLYQKFKEKVDFPKNLKKLFAYIDDYNSYELKTEEAKYINAIYRKSWGGKFQRFVNRFWSGFDGFTDKEIGLAEKFFEELDQEMEKVDLYEGKFKEYKVLSTFSKFSVNEVAAKILDSYDCDVVIVVNPDTNFVSFRKKKDSNADIAYMAEILCDGGGSKVAAGGNIAKKFLEFSETLIKL